MFAALAIGSAAIQAVVFYNDSVINHPVLQFWWLLIIAIFLLFVFQPAIKNNANSIRGKLIIGFAGLIPALIVWLFNDLLTLYLCGAWFLLLLANLNYLCPATVSNKKLLAKVTILIGIALLILPISINRISILLPNLSGGSHFAVFTSMDEKPPRSAYFYRRLASRNALKIYLNTQVYFNQDHQAPLLRLSIDREHIVIAIQNIIYEHAMGFMKFSLQKFNEGNLGGLTLTPNSDKVYLTNPDGYGVVVQGMKIGEEAWIQLPHMDNHQFPTRDQMIIYAVRLFFWALIWLGIWSWRPRKMDAQVSVDQNNSLAT